ncbi:hypothetical protein SAMN05443665_11064 [Actinomadura meyerae]|uniref:Uncharacterized protein n=1 Tax=Actinomadura meyerae TaxID=240840 RepID=A0A239P956_9ACTN|nr:hypothetical protein [Actinomadura meyerae]SNT63413.1 hypothetical protein SAMN05443665_11064 [Actinomadura meyerae]
MITEAVERLISDMGDLSAEQAVHAASARRVARVMDGTAPDGAAPMYAMPALARELRASVDALTGAAVLGQGVSVARLNELLEVL